MNRTKNESSTDHYRNTARMLVATTLVAGLALPHTALAAAAATDNKAVQVVPQAALSSAVALEQGWNSDEAGFYYVNADGSRATGWLQDDGSWYLLDEEGYRLSGWQQVAGTWYYLAEDGVMLTGWQYVDDAWYYLGSSGHMHTGWIVYNGYWYYLNASGRMAQGWIKDAGSWYYLDESGYMYASTTTPDGYYVLANGAWDGRDPGEGSFVQEWASRIDAYLAGSATAGCGEYYAQAAWDYGVDPRILPAISCIESGKGAVCWTSYNAWGWMSHLGNSWAESIDSITRQFARMYGYAMTYEGALAYAANGEEAYWLSLVESEMARI